MHAKQNGHGPAAMTIIPGATVVPSHAVRLQVPITLVLPAVLKIGGTKKSAQPGATTWAIATAMQHTVSSDVKTTTNSSQRFPHHCRRRQCRRQCQRVSRARCRRRCRRQCRRASQARSPWSPHRPQSFPRRSQARSPRPRCFQRRYPLRSRPSRRHRAGYQRSHRLVYRLAYPRLIRLPWWHRLRGPKSRQ